MQTILVCFDGSKHALKALHIASDLADKYGAKIHVLEVLAQSSATGEMQSSKNLELAEARLRKRGIENYKLEIDTGSPAPAILLAARLHKISTIVMGCRGHREKEEDQLGRVSQAVFRQAECTLIAVK